MKTVAKVNVAMTGGSLCGDAKVIERCQFYGLMVSCRQPSSRFRDGCNINCTADAIGFPSTKVAGVKVVDR